MVSMLGMFRSFHVHIDLGRKEFLWRSVLEYVRLSFNGWCANKRAFDFVFRETGIIDY